MRQIVTHRVTRNQGFCKKSVIPVLVGHIARTCLNLLMVPERRHAGDLQQFWKGCMQAVSWLCSLAGARGLAVLAVLAQRADRLAQDRVGYPHGLQRVRERLLVALAHVVGEQLVVQLRLHVEVGRQQQARPHPANEVSHPVISRLFGHPVASLAAVHETHRCLSKTICPLSKVPSGSPRTPRMAARSGAAEERQ